LNSTTPWLGSAVECGVQQGCVTVEQ
jgi:hypothetical protein